MRKIIAIGGGEILKDDLTRETTLIDKEIIKLSGKRHPRMLFIPTASHDAVGYRKNIYDYFETELGCEVEYLLLYSELNENIISTKIEFADIIYAGGGNTFAMMKRWRSFGVDKMLSKAMERGAVMSGLSAGAICWFAYGASDSRKFKNPNADMIKVTGLGFVDAVFCPHYNSQPHRGEFLKELMRKTSGPAIAVDDCCAIEISGNEYRIISSVDSANAYKVYWDKGIYHKDKINKMKEYCSLTSLLNK